MTSDFLRATSCGFLFAALAYSPWAYGATTSAGILITNWLLLTALILWIAELLISRRKPMLPRLLVFLIVALIAIGAWMVFNAMSIYDSAFEAFVPLRNFAPRLTGSIDYALSAAWMIRATLLLGTVLFVVDLCQDNRWLLRLWYVIGVVAGSITLLGLLQKATGARMIFWQSAPPESTPTFFATYYYHANAGAFLNLVLPLTAGLALRAFTMPSGAGTRALWASVFVLTLASIFANTSRMAQLIGLMALIALSLFLGPKIMRRLSGAERNVSLGGALAILFVLLALGQASHLEQPLSRWQHLGEAIPSNWRWLASQVAIRALPDVGVFGFGPGAFRSIFPHYNSLLNDLAPGGWRFLHEDYLQTVLEWGWLGSFLWALLLFGGIAVAVRSLRNARARAWSRRRRLMLPLAMIALGSVALHALVDFPLQIESIQLYAATCLGICWGSARWEGAR